MPYVIILTLIVVLSACALLFDGADDDAGAALRPDPIERIIARVERERGLRFERDPDPRTVTAGQARREGLASLDEDYPPARRRADEDTLALLGLLPAGADLAAAMADTYEQAVAGYYDPRSGQLRIVEGAQTANRVLYEMTVAHELDHALEDQRFGFELRRLTDGRRRGARLHRARRGLGDRADVPLRRRALRAGGGVRRHRRLRVPADRRPAAVPDGPARVPVPRGRDVRARLLEVGGGKWTVVDAALEFRPPASTEQVMHPQKYLEVEQPRRVSVRAPVAALGPGWRERHVGTLGEWLTARLLARAGGTGGGAAAAGWGGDRYALLARGDERALVARWTWDTPRDADEFAAALRAWGDEGLPDTEAAGPDAWRTPGGAAALSRRGGAITLALAPDVALARRAARAEG